MQPCSAVCTVTLTLSPVIIPWVHASALQICELLAAHNEDDTG
eukprot:CAMPEP_0185181926 /NCGR_PEP_ID=MMETSP1140-20130426/992_1 /TAXON_ID=298111 /ORGANISM="Pavlova sp., Strain CCMP459" /LENGTH=42 /DNA_ID= /DNA_START= /DNA_END= /DNA_ORIENTATION=